MMGDFVINGISYGNDGGAGPTGRNGPTVFGATQSGYPGERSEG
jgi:hypothetical protein